MIWTFVFCLIEKTCWALFGLLPVSLGWTWSLETQRAKLHPWHLTLFHHCWFWNGSVIILLVIVAFSYCWKKVPTVSEKVPVLSSCFQEISSLSLGDVSNCLTEALAVHEIQRTVTNCSVTLVGKLYLSLSTSWQSAFSLGQTNKFLYCRWANCKRLSGCSWRRKTDPSAQPAGCWQHGKKGVKSQVCI